MKHRYRIKLCYQVYDRKANQVISQNDILERQAKGAEEAVIQAIKAISGKGQIINLQLMVTLVHDVSRGEDGL